MNYEKATAMIYLHTLGPLVTMPNFQLEIQKVNTKTLIVLFGVYNKLIRHSRHPY